MSIKRNKEKDRAYYLANVDKIKARAVKHKRDNPSLYKTNRFKREQEKKAYILEYKLSHPCMNCGEKDFVVLEFDHLIPSNKEYGIANMVHQDYSLTALKKEINKCQVLCANCHRRKHYYERVQEN